MTHSSTFNKSEFKECKDQLCNLKEENCKLRKQITKVETTMREMVDSELEKKLRKYGIKS